MQAHLENVGVVRRVRVDGRERHDPALRPGIQVPRSFDERVLVGGPHVRRFAPRDEIVAGRDDAGDDDQPGEPQPDGPGGPGPPTRRCPLSARHDGQHREEEHDRQRRDTAGGAGRHAGDQRGGDADDKP